MRAVLLLLVLLSSCGHTPECDDRMAAPYLCSDVARQAKINALVDCATAASRDGLLVAMACQQTADNLRGASSDADRALYCAQADHFLAQAICDYDGNSYPGAVDLVVEWRQARGMQ